MMKRHIVFVIRGLSRKAGGRFRQSSVGLGTAQGWGQAYGPGGGLEGGLGTGCGVCCPAPRDPWPSPQDTYVPRYPITRVGTRAVGAKGAGYRGR